MWNFNFLLTFYILSAALVGASPANPITVYGVIDPEFGIGDGLTTTTPASYSISRLGVGPSGETTYVAVAVATEVAIEATGTTLTIPTMTATTFTFVEDSKGITEIIPATIGNQTLLASAGCNFDGTTKAGCVALGIAGTQTLAMTTYTGVPTPIYTIEAGSSSSPGTDDATAKPSSARSLSKSRLLVLTGLVGVVSGAVMVLGM